MTSLNTPPSQPDVPRMQKDVTSWLSGLAGKIRFQIAFDASVRSLATLLGLLTLSLVLDFWLELSLAVRLLYWLVTLAAMAHFLYRYGIKPLRRKLGPVQVAEAVDIAQGHDGEKQLAPRVASVLQLPEMLGDEEALSGQMIGDAVGRSYHWLMNVDLTGAINQKHKMQCMSVLFAALLIPGAVGGIMSGIGENVLGTWAQRWLMLQDTAYPRNTSIDVAGLEDGKLVIPAGENYTLRTTIKTKDGTEIEEVRIVLRAEGDKDRSEPLTKFDDNDYRLEMTPVTKKTEATITAGDQTLRFEIIPAERPRLLGMEITSAHPSDPDNPKTVDFNGVEGEVSLLKDNKVELRLTANVPLAKWRYTEDSKERAEGEPALPPIEKIDEKTLAIRWTHKAPMRFRIELIGKAAGLVSEPIPVSVGEKNDRKPKVRIRFSGVGPRITPKALIPLSIEARDDFGLKNMGIQITRLGTGRDSEKKTFDPIIRYTDPNAERKDASNKFALEIKKFGVRPTDVVRITGIATDNRYLDNQTGKSLILSFTIVTRQELLREIIARQQTARAQFRKAIKQCQDMQTVLATTTDPKEAVALSRRLALVMRSVQKLSIVMERAAEEMRLNRLEQDGLDDEEEAKKDGSDEDKNKKDDGVVEEAEEGSQTYQWMKARILDPLKDLHSNTMQDQRNALAEAGGANVEQIRQLAKDQQEMVDTMVDLLQRMNRWDQLLDAINQLNEVIDYQDLVRKIIKGLIDEEKEKAFDEFE